VILLTIAVVPGIATTPEGGLNEALIVPTRKVL
jgi:hypothetical protein